MKPREIVGILNALTFTDCLAADVDKGLKTIDVSVGVWVRGWWGTRR